MTDETRSRGRIKAVIKYFSKGKQNKYHKYISYKDDEQEWIGYMCLMSLSVQKSFIQYTNA